MSVLPRSVLYRVDLRQANRTPLAEMSLTMVRDDDVTRRGQKPPPTLYVLDETTAAS
jgi:hypothetical protein